MEVKREQRCRIRKRINIVRKINRRINNPLLEDEIRESIWCIRVGINFQKAILEKIAYSLLKLDKPLFALTIALRQYEICLVLSPGEKKLPSYQIALSAMQLNKNHISTLLTSEIQLIVSWQYHIGKINLLLSIAEAWQTKFPDRSSDIVLFVMSAFQFDYPQSITRVQSFQEIDSRISNLIFYKVISDEIAQLWGKIVINFEKQNR